MSDTLTREQALEIYYYLQLNRRFEEALARLFRQNKIVGGLYGSLGQEAISVGSAYALGPGDWMAPMIRNIGALLVRGFGPAELFAQFMGRAESPTRGKDNGSHVADLQARHVVAPTSMLGDLIPIMAGVGMAGRYLGQKIVGLTWIGDGGSSTGAFHEGLNFAAAQKAPLVVILENNQWAYSTPVNRQVPLRDLAERARAYGIASAMVDGNDVEAVFRATSAAIEYARSGRGPFLLEAKTMRMTGHAQHDAAEYVPRAMLEYWKALDPLERYERQLQERHVLDAQLKSEIAARIARELDAALAQAESVPFPPPESAAEGVYCAACHAVAADWQRPREDLLPPKSSVVAAWTFEHFGPQATGGVTRDVVGDADAPPAENSAALNGRPLPHEAATKSARSKIPETTYLDAIREALWEEMERDPAVLLIGEDIGVYGGAFQATAGLLERFGWERVIDTPISETAIVGAAVGMSYLGLRPVAEMQFIDFIACAFNQITNVAAKSHYRAGAPAPLVIRGPSGGGVHGGPFHSANPEMYFVHTPGLKVVCPATPYDAKGLLKAAIRDNNPVLFFEHKLLYRRIKEKLPADDYTVPLDERLCGGPEAI